MERTPTGAGQMLIALDMWLGPMQELVLLGGKDATRTQHCKDRCTLAIGLTAVVAYRPASGEQSPHLKPLFEGRHGRQRPADAVCLREFHLPGADCRREEIRKALS